MESSPSGLPVGLTVGTQTPSTVGTQTPALKQTVPEKQEPESGIEVSSLELEPEQQQQQQQQQQEQEEEPRLQEAEEACNPSPTAPTTPFLAKHRTVRIQMDLEEEFPNAHTKNRKALDDSMDSELEEEDDDDMLLLLPPSSIDWRYWKSLVQHTLSHWTQVACQVVLIAAWSRVLLGTDQDWQHSLALNRALVVSLLQVVEHVVVNRSTTTATSTSTTTTTNLLFVALIRGGVQFWLLPLVPRSFRWMHAWTVQAWAWTMLGSTLVRLVRGSLVPASVALLRASRVGLATLHAASVGLYQNCARILMRRTQPEKTPTLLCQEEEPNDDKHKEEENENEPGTTEAVPETKHENEIHATKEKDKEETELAVTGVCTVATQTELVVEPQSSSSSDHEAVEGDVILYVTNSTERSNSSSKKKTTLVQRMTAWAWLRLCPIVQWWQVLATHLRHRAARVGRSVQQAVTVGIQWGMRLGKFLTSLVQHVVLPFVLDGVLPLACALGEMTLVATAAWTATRPLELWMAWVAWPIAFYPVLFGQVVPRALGRLAVTVRRVVRSVQRRVAQWWPMNRTTPHGEPIATTPSKPESSTATTTPSKWFAAAPLLLQDWEEYLERLYLVCCNTVLMVAWARVGHELLRAWTSSRSSGGVCTSSSSLLDTALTCSLWLEVLNAIISWTRYSTATSHETKSSSRRSFSSKRRMPRLQVLLLLAGLRMALHHAIVTPLLLLSQQPEHEEEGSTSTTTSRWLALAVRWVHGWTVACWSLGDTLRFACFVWTDVSELIVQWSSSTTSYSSSSSSLQLHPLDDETVHDDDVSVVSTTSVLSRILTTTQSTTSSWLLWWLHQSTFWAPWTRYTLVEPILFPLTSLGEWTLIVLAASSANRPLELWCIVVAWPVLGLRPLWNQLERQRRTACRRAKRRQERRQRRLQEREQQQHVLESPQRLKNFQSSSTPKRSTLSSSSPTTTTWSPTDASVSLASTRVAAPPASPLMEELLVKSAKQQQPLSSSGSHHHCISSNETVSTTENTTVVAAAPPCSSRHACEEDEEVSDLIAPHSSTVHDDDEDGMPRRSSLSFWTSPSLWLRRRSSPRSTVTTTTSCNTSLTTTHPPLLSAADGPAPPISQFAIRLPSWDNSLRRQNGTAHKLRRLLGELDPQDEAARHASAASDIMQQPHDERGTRTHVSLPARMEHLSSSSDP